MISEGIEDEDKWLTEGIAGLQHNAFYMHRALDSNNLRDALKYSAQMLSELRTSRLTPHKYYELYMRAFDELRKLEMFFREETKRDCSIIDLYELVQHAGNILPRLFDHPYHFTYATSLYRLLIISQSLHLTIDALSLLDITHQNNEYHLYFRHHHHIRSVLPKVASRADLHHRSSRSCDPCGRSEAGRHWIRMRLQKEKEVRQGPAGSQAKFERRGEESGMLTFFTTQAFIDYEGTFVILTMRTRWFSKAVNVKYPSRYLLCTVGSVYIKSKEAPAKDVLKDLVEMCRGIQHPVRGLFLRSYLSQVSRDKLPDIGSEYEGDADTVMDAVEFVLQNFTEMNKLWVRMQHQGPAREKEKREKERSELRDLVISVGKNLHVLSQIEGVDLDMYRETVLPRILEQVVNCKDELAQYYLMDCIIQVFPDEYHLQTLETLLGACPQLQPTVDIKTVLSQLMDRLSNYAASSVEVLPEFLQVEAFAKLSNAIGKVIEAQVDMPVVGAVALYVSLLTFTLRVHPDRLDYVDQVLGACVKKLTGKVKLEDSKATKQIVALLSAPLEKYNDIVIALKLSNYPRVMDHLDSGTNKVMAVVIIQSIMKNSTCISTADNVEALFELIKGLIKDLDGTSVDELDEEDFKEEQSSVARLIHMFYNDDAEEMLKVIAFMV
ncbi:hypothetical protein GIB67_015681 [Kingdonia uniflora]|uniref:Vacuolar protein sorting-associated protein 35 n=1 Tax=Kingdonia uniflora TaxID=39325 RepID=A0A7J7NU96_9MAGN|nr:hypothetical protein GIB67_015681 [Kingdonia uniflora]